MLEISVQVLSPIDQTPWPKHLEKEAFEISSWLECEILETQKQIEDLVQDIDKKKNNPRQNATMINLI